MPRRRATDDTPQPAPEAPPLPLPMPPVELPPAEPPEVLEEEDEDLPLFPAERGVLAIAVYRVQPADGYLGELDPGATEEDVRSRWGGGLFELKVRDQAGRVRKGGVRRLRIAGEPRSTQPAQASPAPQPDLAPVLQAKDDYVRMVKAEAEASLQRREKELELQLRREAAQLEAQLAREQSRWQQQVEAQRQLHEQTLARDRERMDSELQRQREHHSAVMQLQQQQTQLIVEALRSSRGDGMGASEVVALLREGMELGGGGAREDGSVAMVKAIGDGLQSMATVADRATSDQVPVPGSRRLARGPAPVPRAGPAQVAGTASPLERKVAKVAALLSEKGLDPERILDGLISGELGIVPASELADEGEDEENAPDESAGPSSPGADSGGAAPAALGADRAGDGNAGSARPGRVPPA